MPFLRGVDLNACLCGVIGSTCLLQETQKFRAELSRRLLKEKETFGHDLHSVTDVCAEVCHSDFLRGFLFAFSLVNS